MICAAFSGNPDPSYLANEGALAFLTQCHKQHPYQLLAFLQMCVEDLSAMRFAGLRIQSVWRGHRERRRVAVGYVIFFIFFHVCACTTLVTKPFFCALMGAESPSIVFCSAGALRLSPLTECGGGTV